MEKSIYAKREEEILKFWKKNKIFERSVDERPKNEPYVFYDGPPFATGLPHYGHILSSVIKDVIPRYFTMKDKRVRRRWGWDCHGLPVEILVEKKLKISGKKEIEKIGVNVFNQTARSLVLSYVSQWEKTIERIGRWVEFKNSYKTMDSTYMESVWWALKQLWDKDLIYEGRKVLMYCPRCETPVSNAEIAMDNSYRDITEESVIVKFKIKNSEKYHLPKETFFLAWTTTPWTLPANVALAVGRKIEYVLAEKNNQNLILAKSLAKKILKDNFKIIKRFKGSNLVSLEYEPLYNLEGVRATGKKAWYVAEADFVTTEEGTGIVHTAVIYGEDDFKLGQKIDLPQVPLIDSAGRYNKDAPAFLKGIYIKAAEKIIIADLEKRQLLFDKFSYTHSYPFCWRCESPLIYNAVSAWFIDIQSNKKKIIDFNEKINWFPPNLKHGRFFNIIKTAPDWNISRNRYWATPLPFWKCPSCQKTVCLGSADELKEKAVNYKTVYQSQNVDNIDLHKPQIDEIILKCPQCKGEMRRIAEVVDGWVESASMPFAEWHYPFENEKEFKSRFPSQFIGEYIAQTRTWFYYMHALAVLLFDNIAFENVSVTGTILAEDGSKMSKSKGNFPDPQEMIDKYGADALRFYLMSSVVMQADNLFFSEREIKEHYNKIINSSYNVLNFYLIYAKSRKPNKFEFEKLSILDQWIVSRLNGFIEKAKRGYDSYNTVKVCFEIKNFISELSTWWLRRSRERFRDEREIKQVLAVLSYLLKKYAQVIAPVIPFVAEEIWQKVKGKSDPLSVHLSFWPIAEAKLRNKNIEEQMNQARKIVELGHSLRAEKGIRVRQPIAIVDWNVKFEKNVLDFEKLILEELNAQGKGQKNQMKKPAGAKADAVEVSIETKLDPKLIELGDLRELTRLIQERRKASGLKQGELSYAVYWPENKKVETFVRKNIIKIRQAASLSSFEPVEKKSAEDLAEGKLSVGKIFVKICEAS